MIDLMFGILFLLFACVFGWVVTPPITPHHVLVAALTGLNAGMSIYKGIRQVVSK